MSGFNLKYFLREGLSNIFVHGFMSFAAVTVIAACFLITGTFGLVAYNIDILIQDLEKQNEIVVFIDETMTREQAVALGDSIKAIGNVEKIVFVSKEEAFDSYLDQLGDDSYIMEELRESNPLRDGYRVIMRDISLHSETITALEEIEGIANTNSQKDISDRLIQLRRVVNAISYTLIGLLGAVSVFIISNTVKLAMFARRDEVGIMKMVGATNGFIRTPFIIEGMSLGLLASIIAFFAQWGVYNYITKGLMQGTEIFKMVEFATFDIQLLGLLMGVGAVIGIFGSVFTIRKFLKV